MVHITAYAAVSEDGMLANAGGIMPDALKIDADQQFYHRGLAQADVLVHGAHSQEHFADTAHKPRLVLTRQTPGISPHPTNPNALCWNPAGASFAQALGALKAPHDRVAIIGATKVFAFFLDSYDSFYLSRVSGVHLPGGTPIFPGVPTQTPEQVLASHGMERGADEVTAPALVITRWQRRAAG